MSMFQNRRTIFLFICSIVLVQALYYIVTLQIRKNDRDSIQSLSVLIYNQSSDRQISSVQISNKNLSNTNFVQVRLTEALEKTKKENRTRGKFVYACICIHLESNKSLFVL